jgi:hypothetical protein
MTNVDNGMRSRSLFAVVISATLLAALAGCSSGGSSTPLCPSCGLQTYAVVYRSSFTSGDQPGPVNFTATGQNATVQVNAVQNGTTTPYSGPVTGTLAAPCSAATVQGGGAGHVVVTSVASGNCTLLLSGASFNGLSIQIHVP